MNSDSGELDPEEIDVRANAEEWFGEDKRFLAWLWKDEVPGPCPPVLVANAVAGRSPLPASVASIDANLLCEAMVGEFRLEGGLRAEIPIIEVLGDESGRIVWAVDFSNVPPKSQSVGVRALVRGERFGTWNRDRPWYQYPGSPKFAYLNCHGELFYDPTASIVVDQFELLEADEGEELSFLYLLRKGGAFHAWVLPEGCVVEIGLNGFGQKNYRARYPGPDPAVRSLEYGPPFAENETIPRSVALDLVVDFIGNPSSLPRCRNIHWRLDDQRWRPEGRHGGDAT